MTCDGQNAAHENVCTFCGADLVIENRFRALRVLGQGGFGKTFLGLDEKNLTGELCAIKLFLPAEHNRSRKAEDLFRQEAQFLTEINDYPHIPKFVAFCEQDDRLYLVQEFIDGLNLAQILTDNGPMSQAQIIKLLESLLPVLQFIHKRQIIHRDIKPANIIRRNQDGKWILVDFGAVKQVSEADLALTGTTLGSAEYVAPEQARGKAVFASDLYSLGVTCLHLLTGVPPFDLMDMDSRWVWRGCVDEPIAEPLGTVLDRLVLPQPSQRYPSAAMALADLNRPTSILQTPLNRWLTWGGKIGLPAVLMAAIAYLFFPKSTVERPQSEASTPPSSSSATPTLISNPTELKALENLVLLATVQGRQYQQKGTFLTEFSMEPKVPQYRLHLIPLQRNGLQIVAQPQTDGLKSFIVLLWGGPRSARSQQVSKSDSSNPWEEFPLTSVPVINGQSSSTVVMNYCQSDRPTRELPAKVRLPNTEPTVYGDFRCPSGYGFAASMTEIVGKLAVQTLPSFVFKNPDQ